MFYHFKGTIRREDQEFLLSRSVWLMQAFSTFIMFVGMMFTAVSSKTVGDRLFTAIAGLIIIIAINLFFRLFYLKSQAKRFKEIAMDEFITKEQLEAQFVIRRAEVVKDRIYLFQARNQALIFRKDMLVDQTQWESFVTMAQGLVKEKGK